MNTSIAQVEAAIRLSLKRALNTLDRPRPLYWKSREFQRIALYRPRGWAVGAIWNQVPGYLHLSFGRWELGVWVGLASSLHESYRCLNSRWTLEWSPGCWGLWGSWIEPDTRPGSRRALLKIGPWALEYRVRAPEGEARPCL
jgi:hypothetical protein